MPSKLSAARSIAPVRRPAKVAAPAQQAGKKLAAKGPASTTRPTAQAAAEPSADAKATRKAAKSRPKLVRDSFTMPEADFAVIALLKNRALGARRAARKSELLRAGLRALAKLDAKALVMALDQLEPVKAGRPKKGH